MLGYNICENSNEGNCSQVATTYSRGAYSRLGPHQQSIGYRNFNQVGIELQSCLVVNFNHAKTKSAMTHILVLSEEGCALWQTLDIGHMFGQLLASKFHNNFNLSNKITEKFTILLISIFLHGFKNLKKF